MPWMILPSIRHDLRHQVNIGSSGIKTLYNVILCILTIKCEILVISSIFVAPSVQIYLTDVAKNSKISSSYNYLLSWINT